MAPPAMSAPTVAAPASKLRRLSVVMLSSPDDSVSGAFHLRLAALQMPSACLAIRRNEASVRKCSMLSRIAFALALVASPCLAAGILDDRPAFSEGNQPAKRPA